jgi:5'-3' exonuclease
MDNRRVVLIDLSSLFWTAWMVNNENGVQQARSITLENVKRCIASPDDLVAICTDEGKSFRKDISPEYKATREKQPEAAYGELQKTKDRLRADGYLLWGANGFEADDVIATACKSALNRGHEVRICSSDKDMLALVNVKVDCLRTHTWSVVGPAQVMEKFKIEPSQFMDYLALVGDSSDNVPGVAGIGGGRASELLTKYETFQGIFSALDAGEDVPHMAKLRAGRDAANLSLELVRLRYDAPIDFNEIYAERRVMPLTQSESLPEDGDPTDDSSASSSVSDASAEAGTHISPSSTTIADTSRPAQESVALVPVVEYERQLEPRSLRAAVWLGQHLFDSRLYEKFKTPEAITAVIIRGRELGLGATTALDCFHVIEGKPTPYAYLMIARAKAHHDCEYFYCKEANAESATWVEKNRRNPVETSVTYTLEQAKTANLYKGGWLKNPEDMLTKTAGAKLARRAYPDAALGLYAVVEMGGDE